MISFSIAQTEENFWNRLVKTSDEFVIYLYSKSDGKLHNHAGTKLHQGVKTDKLKN